MRETRRIQLGAPTPVFIVGMSRSGTTLLAAALAAHSRLHCGPETHFFSKLNKRDRHSAVYDRNWPRLATAQLVSLYSNGQPIHRTCGLRRRDVFSYLRTQPPSEMAMLEALAGQGSKPRWVEKTPIHLCFLNEVFGRFPASKVIHIVRDPRDVALSLCNVPWGSRSWVANVYTWLYRISGTMSNWIDKRVLVVRYEDFVSDPERTLGVVCAHIGESYEPSMLDTSISGARLVVGARWKTHVAKPIDRTRVERWKREVAPQLAAVAELACFEWLAAFGYDLTHEPRHTDVLFPFNRECIERNEDLIVRRAAALHRLLPLVRQSEFLGRDDLLVTGVPSLGESYCERILASGKLSFGMALRRLLRKKTSVLATEPGDALRNDLPARLAHWSIVSFGSPAER